MFYMNDGLCEECMMDVYRMYDFNLLVSCSWSLWREAMDEVKRVLKELGDENPLVTRTLARGILGVRTSLDSRFVVRGVREMFKKDPWSVQYTLKLNPIDAWTTSNMDSIRDGVSGINDGILKGEKWRMTVEKRRYTRHHKSEIIKEIAELIDEEVDLEKPDKILRIEIIGMYAGLSILKPDETFSVARAFSS
jgi:tRNA acetyltransferase TAN1